MFNLAKKEELITAFTSAVADNIKITCSDLDLEGFMKDSEVDLIRESIQKIRNNIIVAIPEELEVPKFSMYITATGKPEVNLVTITITNRVTDAKKFKFSQAITKKNAVEKVQNFLTATYTELLIDGMIEKNLIRVNEVLATAVHDAGLSYELKVTSPLGNIGKKISVLTDDEIIFVADEDRAFELEDILVLQEVTELITEEMIQKAFQQEVETIAGAQIPEQLVAIHGGLLVSYICDISKLIKPMTLIRKVVSRDVKRLTGKKDTLAYYADGDIFAIVARRDGHFEVVLSPFNIKTLRKENVDVLKGLGTPSN